MGKRSGNFVSARDLLDDVGCDVLRFFLLQRSANSEINFDLDLAREHSDRNPVFKIQYAHARICSLFRKAEERGIAWDGFKESDIEHLLAAEEKDLIREIASLPETVERAARALETHPVPVYLLGLAELFNRYWSQAKVDPEYRMIDPDAPERTQARLTLAAAIRIALANGLHLLGVEAPERMEREEEEGIES
jgi:arginyl-tRNA synthetase